MTSHTQLSEGSDQAEFETVLLGRRIVAVDQTDCTIPPSGESYQYPVRAEGTLTLDDGTVLYVTPNQGGCACSAGDYWLEHLATVDNIVTAVRVVDEATGDHSESRWNPETNEYTPGHYSIFVVADAAEVNILRVEGDDGNGYYGTGYTITVVKP